MSISNTFNLAVLFEAAQHFAQVKKRNKFNGAILYKLELSLS